MRSRQTQKQANLPWVKTLLTLHRHTGKSKEEHEAAGTLLDLSLESVVSKQEMEEQFVHQFPEPLPDDEPIDSHVDHETQTDKKMLRMRHASKASLTFNAFS